MTTRRWQTTYKLAETLLAQGHEADVVAIACALHEQGVAGEYVEVMAIRLLCMAGQPLENLPCDIRKFFSGTEENIAMRTPHNRLTAEQQSLLERIRYQDGLKP